MEKEAATTAAQPSSSMDGIGGKQGKNSSPEFVNKNATGHFLLKQLHL
jgi:hypothetical protein